jgi:hypothetical protein
MAWTPPRYLLASTIQAAPLGLFWDEQHGAGILPADGEVMERAYRLSWRAGLAYSIGVAEWIVYRQLAAFADPLPAEYLEAAWASVVDLRYSNCGEASWGMWADDAGWSGPARGPVRQALRYVDGACSQIFDRNGHVGWVAAHLAALATYVLPETCVFGNWSRSVLTRLESLYPCDPQDELGDVVPREALDPGIAFDPGDTEALVRAFLLSLEPAKNRWLNTAQEMLSPTWGFRDVPYTFDLQQDRASRDRG